MAKFEDSNITFYYWPVEEGKLIAGSTPVSYESYASKQYIKHLLDMGVRTFISLQEEDEVARKPFAFYHDALQRLAEERGVETTFIRVPVMDGTVFNDASIVHLLDMIDAANKRNQIVYIHCLAGHGRTGTIVGCWLARHGLRGEDALNKITELRSHDPYLREKKCPQKPAQTNKVRSWSEKTSAL
ncbi:dual specificity protein phosphatase family protein [Pleionea sp. CnH1-48]|uniref:protein-tyrosine phosphatase family protein n=1 Tax=Pleionea sp. CnH1-48 TaxID=2954494 RepID=UPI002097E642|nr:dual specificity protein phosphatase family protein [Pleionea sp. CnH1-48]MCO7222947.1 dual specificity protein phosphatase family protein [Pleionea sp. CnH1-48]